MKLDKRIVVVYIITIALILLGVTYALTSSDISLALSTANIDINYSDGSNGVLDISNLKLYPILDNNVSDNTSNVIRINFTVGGSSNNVIYDIALNEIVADNELLSKYVKWRLYKNNELISEGSLSPEFDTISNGRLVLTNIQQDLTTSDSYEFILWLSDSCQEEDITKCIDTENQEYLLNKNITGKIEIEAYTGNKKALVRKPSITDNSETLYSMMSSNATIDTNIDFSQISSDTNGKGVYIRSGTENDTYPIYYYRGDVDDNNVIFADMCFKIVRTTETGGVKLIYNGLPSNGTCDNTGSASQIGTKAFNSSNNSLTYVGYMYGTVYTSISKSMSSVTDTYYYGNDVTYSNGTYTLVDTISSNDWSSIYNGGLNNYHYTCLGGTTCTSVHYIYYTESSTMYYITLTNGKKLEDALDNNVTSSTIKGNNTTSGTLDYWYYNNIEQKGYSGYIEDTIWCNDRSIYQLGGWNRDGGNTRTDLLFGAMGRFYLYQPSFSCVGEMDNFTVSNKNGNGDLDYPVGLLTADEAVFAGGGITENNFYYLYTGSDWWLGTPTAFIVNKPDITILNSTGTLITTNPSNTNIGVRPSISLKNNIVVTEGNGTVNDPYILNVK